MTETKTAPPRTTPSCPACSMVRREVEALNVGLALGKSPRRLSRSFMSLSRVQIKAHRDQCLLGDPLGAVARERGWTDEPKAAVETSRNTAKLTKVTPR